VDPTFDELLESLARIAQKQLKRVVESVLRWRHDQSKTMDDSLLRLHMYVPSSYYIKFSADDIIGMVHLQAAALSKVKMHRPLSNNVKQ
jgi:hypothetical protein